MSYVSRTGALVAVGSSYRNWVHICISEYNYNKYRTAQESDDLSYDFYILIDRLKYAFVCYRVSSIDLSTRCWIISIASDE